MTIEKQAPGGKPGNQNAAKHTLYGVTQNALRLRTRRVQRRVSNCYKNYPWLMPTDRPAVRSWAELDVITSIMFTILENTGVISGTSKGDITLRRMLGEYRLMMMTKRNYEHDLGMSPAGRLALGRAALLPTGDGKTLEAWSRGEDE